MIKKQFKVHEKDIFLTVMLARNCSLHGRILWRCRWLCLTLASALARCTCRGYVVMYSTRDTEMVLLGFTLIGIPHWFTVGVREPRRHMLQPFLCPTTLVVYWTNRLRHSFGFKLSSKIHHVCYIIAGMGGCW